MNDPKLSIITIVFNGREYIGRCIENIHSQQCKDMEHIIIDGASTDGTVDIIKQYARKYHYIHWTSERDQGASDATNKGVSIARGSIIGICHADDYYESGVLNRVLNIFEDCRNPSLIVGNCNVWGDDGNLIKINKPSNLKLTNLLLEWNLYPPYPFNPSQFFYHRSLHEKIGLWDVTLKSTSDKDFIIRAVQAAHVKYFDETWGNFRIIKGTQTYRDIEEGVVKDNINRVLDAHREKLPKHLQFVIYLKTRIKHYLRIG